ncbi:uncharacterized protein Z520_05856 [Fonsecaea multimorphosa CBS 102226]|uniref:Uncharacterized protein n=1 Tax=Fonsecaea multimorphosa CBS 102226 TaxID=1442371 RepID=A0A0D2H9L1_9EURO|nr:uncharacterized protein Z520_05856 [Fonsecaea multimorphosa CBS 102226]KIX98555.1 hypothetical protein Z520_05856 [Fonsecaea multimorphosa CBS 102226]OAL24746.1 hypothetical protein AYO22_05535 [Fonsecaea multimorphosa]
MSPPPPKLPSVLVNHISSHTGPINAITFSSLGGTYVLTGSSDRQVQLTRTEPSKPENPSSVPIQKYSAHGYPILDIACAQDNQTFASVGGDRAVFLWDVQAADGTLRRFGNNTTQGHTSRITCVAFAGDGDSVLASGSDDTSVRLWDVKSRDARPLMVLEEAKDGISSVVVPGNGHELVAGSIDGRVRSYDIRTGKVAVDVMPGSVTSLDVSRDAKTILVGCLDGRIRLMDRGDGTCLRAFPPEDAREGYKNEGLRLRSCLGANEAMVLSGSESDGIVRAWDVLSGKSAGRVQVSDSGRVVSVVRWREGSQAQARQSLWAGGGADGVVKIYGAG